MSPGSSIRRNTAWIFGGTLSFRVFQFIVGVFLARILVPADFCLLVTIQILTGTLGFIAGGGMGEALVQAKTVNEKDFKSVFTAQLAICILIYAGLFVVSPFFSEWFNDPIYTDLLRISGLNFILRPFLNIPSAKMRRDMQFKRITIIKLIAMVIGSSISILLALGGFGPWALVIGGIGGSLSSLCLLFYSTRWIPGVAYSRNSIKRLGGYGIKISINEIILHIRNQLPNLLLSRILGPGQVGLFNKAVSTSDIPVKTISGSTYQTVFRALSSIQDNLDQSKYIYFRTITLVSIYTYPFYVGLYWTAEPFITFIYGEKWIESAAPLQILAFAGILKCITNQSGAVIAAQNRLGKEIQIQIETLLLFAVATAIGVHWGLVGVAIAILPCYLYLTLRMTSLANSCINGSYSNLARALQPALLMNSALFVILALTKMVLPESLSSSNPGLYLLSMIATGGFTYSGLFLFFPDSALKSEQDRWKRLLRFNIA